MNMELFYLIAIFVVGFLCGDAYAIYKVRKLVSKVLNGEVTIEEVPVEDDKKEPIALQVEITNGIMYLFDANDNFVCQGESLKDLADSALKNKRIEYAKVKHGDNIVYFIKGMVSE